MDQQRKRRIANTLDYLSLVNVGLNSVQIPSLMRGELQTLLTALGTEIATAPNREIIHTMITATKLDLHKKIEETKSLIGEQKEYFRKVTNLATDAIELGLEGGLFIDWSNLEE